MILGTRRHRTCGLEARERLSSPQIQHWDDNAAFLFIFASLAKFSVATVSETKRSASDQSA